MRTIEDVVRAVEENGIEFVRMEFMDYSGITRARTIRPIQLKDVMSKGVNFSTPMLSMDCFDEVLPNPMYGQNDGDFFAVPDPDTFAILPHRRQTARMVCDLTDDNGDPWKGCPRGAFKRLLGKVNAQLGGKVYMAFEQEAYLLKEEEGKLAPADDTLCFSVDGAEIQEDFIHELVHSLKSMGIETEQFSSEYGPGQYEINLKYASALKAADDQIAFAQLFKGLARDRGLIGTLMPKPHQDLPGSGLHVHISMFDDAGRNLFEDENDPRDLNLSEQAYHFIGGLLLHASSLTAIGAPSINSYKRLQPGSWAPAHVCYGAGNRSALVRIPEKRRARRFEYRGADGTCNPYLFAASLVAAGLHGIEARLDPGEVVYSDVTKFSNAELKEKGIRRLPRSLDSALDDLAENKVLSEAIGQPIIEEFINMKRHEWNKYCKHVSEWELRHFSNRY